MSTPPPAGFGDDEELDRRLLTLLLDQPRRTLQLAIATGMAVGEELVRRGSMVELQQLGQNEALCLSACRVVLELWASSARAGYLTEDDFQKMVKTIIRIARAS
jgi:hypothetical protein